ncbi:hypothetical protein BGZ51_000139 [Haplosporangium sp. Z 767]|nr:hypothetical protein BGZ50_000539 [Haplosporangium sp. Z 11]KAF9194387.1 hypothetical protein BGZ51_000139 [Haplosporangium sp. Z 767]
MDFDDQFAQAWQNPRTAQRAPTPPQHDAECNDYWFIPPYIKVHYLREHIQKIANDTGTHMVYNEQQETEERTQKSRRTKGWARPNKELTPAEKRKRDYAEQLQLEKMKYLGTPNEECAYVHCIRIPKNFPLLRLLGGHLENLDPLRTECKSFMWLEQPGMKLYIAGQDEHSTLTAMNRIKNFLYRRLNVPVEKVCHILEKPSTLVEMKIERPMTYIRALQTVVDPKTGEAPQKRINLKPEDPPIKVFHANPVATFENLQDIDRSLAAIDGEHVQSMKYMENMTRRNIESIRQELATSLDLVQLMDYDIKMRIHIGQIGLLEYPKKSLWSLKELEEEVVSHPRLKTEFSTFISRSPQMFAALVKALTPPLLSDYNMEPEVHWTLGIEERDMITGNPYSVQLDVSFREDEKVAFWNGLVYPTTPMDIRVISSESQLSWAWTMTTAKRVNNDKFSAEGIFVHRLRVDKRSGQGDRLIFANTNEVQLKTVQRIKKTLISRDPWMVEVMEEGYWDLKRDPDPSHSFTLSAKPDHVYHSVSMYRDSWMNRFSENPYLGLGQVPTWEPEEFFEGEESIDKTMAAVAFVRSVVEDVLKKAAAR